MLFGVPLFRAFEGVLVAGSRSIFCMELIALTSLILIIFRFFGFSAQNKSYGVLKSKFSVSDRYSVKMILHHEITQSMKFQCQLVANMSGYKTVDQSSGCLADNLVKNRFCRKKSAIF